jgi:two-component system phosphate regulon sensor histidine kinase PhoR
VSVGTRGRLGIAGVAALLAAVVLWVPGYVAAPVVAVTVALVMIRATRIEPVRAPLGVPAADQSSLMFAHLIEPLAEGVLLLDGNRMVVAANPAAGRILERPTDAMVGSSLIVALRDHDLAEVVRAARGVPGPVHVSSSGHDVLATASNVDAGAVRTLLVLEDVTELERARRARADLIANMSHELRTPVAAARALAETLQSGVDDPAATARFHDRLVEEIGRLGEMVDRLLRLSRLESGRETMEDELLVPSDLLRTAVGRIEPLATARGVGIDMECEDGLPRVHGDRERVLEVLSNILDNSLRYSPPGGVVRVSAAAQEPGFVRFAVRDEGTGILPGDRARVFERFYTGDRARGAGGGTGLGLSIARHSVERLGGSIWVADSAPGASLCFTLRAEAQEDEAEAADASDEAPAPR